MRGGLQLAGASLLRPVGAEDQDGHDHHRQDDRQHDCAAIAQEHPQFLPVELQEWFAQELHDSLSFTFAFGLQSRARSEGALAPERSKRDHPTDGYASLGGPAYSAPGLKPLRSVRGSVRTSSIRQLPRPLHLSHT